jgi:hypothetical protein
MLVVGVGMFCVGGVAEAGMPSALPEDMATYLQLHEEPHRRLQSISFFLVGILLSTIALKFLWNFVARDFPTWPRLSFTRAFGLVVLWGLLFVIVLTMISGARELMTPGAWKKVGATYQLAPTEAAPRGVTPEEAAPAKALPSVADAPAETP